MMDHLRSRDHSFPEHGLTNRGGEPGNMPMDMPMDAPTDVSMDWTRRTWLTTTAGSTSALLLFGHRARFAVAPSPSRTAPMGFEDRLAARARRLEPGPVQALAQRAVEAAQAAGATYADARLTRTVEHHYTIVGGQMLRETEFVGCGVRAFVEGAWGFATFPLWESEPQKEDRVVGLARAAVAQAKTAASAKIARKPMELSAAPAVTGTWSTPCQIDPFRVSIEEKRATMQFWASCAQQHNMYITEPASYVHFVRQERVVATSDGSLFTQTCYESGGYIGLAVGYPSKKSGEIRGIEMAGQGWERLLDAKIPEQIAALANKGEDRTVPVPVGRYTIVCDGATMAALTGETLGIATQLDRALGYEANAGGTSFLNDPLAMLGQYSVAVPMVTVTANRSAPAQLATVRWDDEGVVPREATLIKNGVLQDFQTTRELAPWLAPYYEKTGRSAVSNGYAAAESAQYLTLQMRPNLALAPSPAPASLQDLVASVRNGILIENGRLNQVDFQARNAVLSGTMHKISNGRLGSGVSGGSIQINTPQFWKNIKAIGDASTTGIFASTQYNDPFRIISEGAKGNPPQRTSYTAQGVAALVENQAMIDIRRRA